MALTVKKSAPKTLRVAPRPGPGAPAGGSEDTLQPNAAGIPAQAPIGPDVERKRSYTLDIILGILACLMFGALIAIQSIEWNFYKPAFPAFGSAQESLSLGQQWSAAPLGLQMGILLGSLMLLLGLVAMVMTIVKSLKSRSDMIEAGA